MLKMSIAQSRIAAAVLSAAVIAAWSASPVHAADATTDVQRLQQQRAQQQLELQLKMQQQQDRSTLSGAADLQRRELELNQQQRQRQDFDVDERASLPRAAERLSNDLEQRKAAHEAQSELNRFEFERRMQLERASAAESQRE